MWARAVPGLGVMADSASGIRVSLLQLQESLSAGDRCSAAMASYQLIRGLGQECVLSSGPAVLGGYCSGPAEEGTNARARLGFPGCAGPNSPEFVSWWVYLTVF